MWGRTQSLKISPVEVGTLQTIGDNSLIAYKNPMWGVVSPSLGYLDEDWASDSLNGVLASTGQYRDLIECLIHYESHGNIYATGDFGKAVGVLQFWKTTFDFYKNKYGLWFLEYENPTHQVILADLMLRDNPKNAYHWTTYKYCRNYLIN